MEKFNLEQRAYEAIQRINNHVDEHIRVYKIWSLWKECGVIIHYSGNMATARFNEEAKDKLIQCGEIKSPMDFFNPRYENLIQIN